MCGVRDELDATVREVVDRLSIKHESFGWEGLDVADQRSLLCRTDSSAAHVCDAVAKTTPIGGSPTFSLGKLGMPGHVGDQHHGGGDGGHLIRADQPSEDEPPNARSRSTLDLTTTARMYRPMHLGLVISDRMAEARGQRGGKRYCEALNTADSYCPQRNPVRESRLCNTSTRLKRHVEGSVQVPSLTP